MTDVTEKVASGWSAPAPAGARGNVSTPEMEIRKVVGRQDNGYAAESFHHWEIPTYANGRRVRGRIDKAFLDGVPSLSCLDQYKHGDELLVNVYTDELPREQRNPSPWNRLQVYLGRRMTFA